jgi:hypothetical protein
LCIRGDRALPCGVEYSRVQHQASTGAQLLARLKHQHHASGQVVQPGSQQPGCTDQRCDVQVVAAGVHGSRDLRGERFSGMLGDR